MDILETAARVLPRYLIFLFSLCFHEVAHAWVAKKRGDSTAQQLGRLTLNPMVHADVLGTIIVPLAGMMTGSPYWLGWAKPVPVNERNLERPKQDMFWVSFAGPLSNVFLASISAFAFMVYLAWFHGDSHQVEELFQWAIFLNLALAFFNLIPIHPLDGGKVIARFLPDSWNHKLEENQQVLSMLLLGLWFFGGLNFLAIPISWSYEQLMVAARFLVA